MRDHSEPVTEPGLRVRPLAPGERGLLQDLLIREWGAPEIVSRGRVHDAAQADALGAFAGETLVGAATYEIAGAECELLTLNALQARRGIGSRLLAAVSDHARSAGCRRLWLITTNDNLQAIRFYELSGLRLAAVHEGAVDRARELKPEIPAFGAGGVRISDELEFELKLEPR